MKRAFREGLRWWRVRHSRTGAGALLTAGALVSLCGACAVVSMFTDGLVARLLSVVAETTACAVVSVISLTATGHREALARSRLEQRLAPAVVLRILEKPGLVKLRSERREITALFTDVEEFTAMTHHVDPAILVNNLDNYFEGMATIIIAHGGMVDKIVGDAVHALFNAPNDLKDHPQKAVECAIALRSWSEVFRHRPEVATIGFGRTRIGLETGPAIVGDVGIRTKLDYTAHGDAVNVASRLEAANKMLGSSICVGPVAASRCDQSLLRPLGRIIVRGRDCAMTVFEPYSPDAPTPWRPTPRSHQPANEHPSGAAGRFDRLVARQIGDRVARAIACRTHPGALRQDGSNCRLKPLAYTRSGTALSPHRKVSTQR
jgi:adenylate cyclase